MITPKLSCRGAALGHRVETLIGLYERRFGSVPEWLSGLEVNQAVALLGVSLRVGIRLAVKEDDNSE